MFYLMNLKDRYLKLRLFLLNLSVADKQKDEFSIVQLKIKQHVYKKPNLFKILPNV